VCFVVESGTDVRLVDGLAGFAELTVFARTIPGGREITQRPAAPVEVHLGPSSFAGFARQVFGFLRDSKRSFDAILVQGYAAAAVAANLAARTTGTPVGMLVCSPVEAYYRCRRAQSGFGKPFRRTELAALGLMARFNARVGRHYIVLSEHLGQVVSAHGGRARIDVVPVYGVDTSVFRPLLVPRAELRRARGLPVRGSVLFFSSRVAPEKDTATVLDALGRLKQSGREVFLLHRSGGYERLVADAAARGLAEQVIATTAVHPHDELPFDYAASDVCVQSSHAEGLGFSVLEALACGVPVVASGVGGLAETIVDGVTGWSCPPGSAGAMADAIGDALDRPDEARRRAAAGRQLVEQRFERRLVFHALEEVLLGRRDREPGDASSTAAGATRGSGIREEQGKGALANQVPLAPGRASKLNAS
jgi:glycosyltransferase involved in cell wall biosynthesis